MFVICANVVDATSGKSVLLKKLGQLKNANGNHFETQLKHMILIINYLFQIPVSTMSFAVMTHSQFFDWSNVFNLQLVNTQC